MKDLSNKIEVVGMTFLLLCTIFAVAVSSASINTLQGNQLTLSVVQQMVK